MGYVILRWGGPICKVVYCAFEPLRQFPRAVPQEDPEARVRLVTQRQESALRACVDQVKQLDQDDAAYRRVISEPFLLNNRLQGSLFSVDRVGANLRESLRQHQSYLL